MYTLLSIVRSFFILLFLVGSLYTSSQEQYFVKRISDPIKLDGIGNEPAWDGVAPLPVVMHTPNFGKEPTERTEIRIAYDDDYVYVSGRLYDSEPDKIQRPSMKRDELNLNNDWFGIIFDTFNDKENGLSFFTTPSGLRLDMTIFDDAEGEFPINPTWNTFWDVETVVNEEGWFAEMRIPFSSLRFQDDNGRVVMGLITWRWIARKNETIVYPAIPRDWGWWSVFKPSRAQEIVFIGLEKSNPFYLAPYLLAGAEQSYDLNEEGTSYIREDNPELNIGGDLKYGITNNLTLDVTVNPDFAQVEADDFQVNLTRFSLFFPEKRLFFQERSSNFEFSYGGPNRLFYSRQIGIFDEEVVPIYGGVRLVGREGKWDVGLLNMQTAPVKEVDLVSENFGVMRLRRQVINQNTYVGGIITSRIGTDGSYNIAYGLDGIFRIFENDYILFNWSQTFENGIKNNPLSLDQATVQLKWERRTTKGLGSSISLSGSGEDFNPGMGFFYREDYVRLGNGLWYGWVPDEKSKLLQHQIFIRGVNVWRNSDGSTESCSISPGWEFESKAGYTGEVSFEYNYESVVDTFSLSDDVDIPSGDYSFWGTDVEFGLPSSRVFNCFFNIKAGRFFDGERLTLSLMPGWSISNKLDIGGYYEYNNIIFAARDQKFIAHISRFRVRFMLNTRLSVSTFVQHNSADDAVIANFRLRYNPREGNDLYLVYNEDFNTSRYQELPTLPIFNSRTFLIKYTYTFSFGK